MITFRAFPGGVLRFILSTPFTYNPADGNLLMDVEFPEEEELDFLQLDALASATGCGRRTQASQIRSGAASSSRRSPTPNRPKPAHGLPRDPRRLVEAIGGGGTVTPPRAQLRVAGIAERDQVPLVVAALFGTGDEVVVLQAVARPACGEKVSLIGTGPRAPASPPTSRHAPSRRPARSAAPRSPARSGPRPAAPRSSA